MEVILKKSLKVISKEYQIKYEDLKSVSKKYLKSAKEFDESLYPSIDSLIELNDISSIEEIDEYDIDIIKMYCKLREIPCSGSEKEIRKNVTEYFEELFEDLEDILTESDSESEDDSDYESESESESESVNESETKASIKKQKVKKIEKKEPEVIEVPKAKK